ncbi:30S ribosome-binding factor [Buchnera aphidicola (Cinara kochiana kochiana)]|uniref:Ribosome-binding factor A n=1 Tax=Buchnera aphidicola (Cinara kochiana kochiana) TaxID=2518976 RepID=A0A451D5M2_9GAMM|nr:30S ribosome-binding factor RbfA [Buchnera aphidicola]VFP81149.1 30S ribosome-binding factor [Buchnera aphidicola (Cinara kochiana kochiana)]
MLKNFSRLIRLERILHKEIAIIVQRYLRDPRLNFLITILEVKLSSDLSYAKIFFTCLNCQDNHRIKLVLKILQKSEGFIRSLINKNVLIRVIPKLNFIYDTSYTTGMFVSNLIKNIKFK